MAEQMICEPHDGAARSARPLAAFLRSLYSLVHDPANGTLIAQAERLLRAFASLTQPCSLTKRECNYSVCAEAIVSWSPSGTSFYIKGGIERLTVWHCMACASMIEWLKGYVRPRRARADCALRYHSTPPLPSTCSARICRCKPLQYGDPATVLQA